MQNVMLSVIHRNVCVLLDLLEIHLGSALFNKIQLQKSQHRAFLHHVVLMQYVGNRMELAHVLVYEIILETHMKDVVLSVF